MCNEWYWRKVNGVWMWVRGHRPVGSPQPSKRGPQGELFGSASEEIFGVFPDRMGPVIAKGADGAPEWRKMRWGFPPPKAGLKPVTNVRNTSSRQCTRRRCLCCSQVKKSSAPGSTCLWKTRSRCRAAYFRPSACV